MGYPECIVAPRTEQLDIAGPEGRLEAVLMTPESGPVATALLCHAHPLHGGMMHFKLLFHVAKAFQNAGFGVLRFNFRGVGRSEGRHDHGKGEQDDVRAALGKLTELYPLLPLVLGGYSFGSVMTLRVGPADERVSALLLAGFPIDVLDSGIPFEPTTKPKLFVQGDRDEFGSTMSIATFVSRQPEPRKLVVVPEADHYFTGRLDALSDAVSGWLATRPWI
jgi:alpha/beta superfamily hydrolase